MTTDVYVITLRDVYGIDVGGSNYKVASGNFINLQATNISFGFGNVVDQRVQYPKVIEALSVAEDGTSTSVGAGSLTDSSKNWIADQWTYYTLKSSAGVSYAILGNTSTALSFSGASGTPAAGDYQILAPNTTFNDRKERVQYTGLNNPTINIDFALKLYNPLAQETVNSNTVVGLTFKILWDLMTIPNTYFLKDYLGPTTTIATPINALINNTEIIHTTNPKVYSSNGMPVKVLQAQFDRDVLSDNYGEVVKGKLSLVETRI